MGWDGNYQYFSSKSANLRCQESQSLDETCSFTMSIAAMVIELFKFTEKGTQTTCKINCSHNFDSYFMKYLVYSKFLNCNYAHVHDVNYVSS